MPSRSRGWADGNIHAAELTASTAVLYFLHQLLAGYGPDREITHLLDTRALYLVPRLNPDGAELALAERPRHIRSSTRPYPFDEDPVDGLTAEDMDGDGRVLFMHVPDPHGTYKKCEAFPGSWRQEHEQVGAGPYPASEPEVRAMVDFIVKHPNIGAGVSFHTHSGVILRPPGTEPDDAMAPEDLWMYQRLSKLGEQLTGYPAVSVFHDFKYHPKEVITGTQDWVYEHLGAFFWVVEIWSPNKEAGITDYKWIEWYRDHPAEDDLKLLKWSDEHCNGQAHVDWYPFEHPQLGPVELGGWDKMNFWRNPPPHLREREAARFPKWLTTLALSLPKLELLAARAEPLGERNGCLQWRLQVDVGNAGYLPAYISKRGLAHQQARGVVFELELPESAALVSGKPRITGPQLEGHAPKSSMQAFLPTREITADLARAEWIVRAPAGTVVQVVAKADRAGTVRTSLSLR